MDFKDEFVEYQEFLKNEINYLNANFKKLRAIKQNAIDLIEKYKYELRQRYNPINFVQNKSNDISSHNRFSVKKLQAALIVMD